MFFIKKKEKKDLLKIIYDESRLKRYTIFIIGVLIISFAFNVFVLPNDIIYGVSGLGVIFKSLFNLDPSITIFIGSLLLLILSFIMLGYEDTKNTILGSILYPIFVSLTSIFSKYFDLADLDPLLLTLYGALITGFGLGLIFKSGFTTGGTDILNQIVAKYFKISLGNAMYFTDGLLIFSGIFVFGFEKVMYSLIALYIISLITDRVVLGISKSKAFYIVTTKPDEIKEYILKGISHGVTVINARGGFSNDKEKMLLCVIPTNMYFKVKEGLHKIDKNAFFVVTDAYETSGGSIEQ